MDFTWPLYLVTVISTFISCVYSINNGLGMKPPMGWRSWNCYHSSITQTLIEQCVDAVADKSRKVNNVATSLADIGYNRIGVDDNWQLCNSTDSNGNANGHYWHNNSEPNGWPNINTDRFPNLSAMVDYGHSKNVLMGWYLNNCICYEHNIYPANMVNDVSFLRHYDFDGIKFDGCGSSRNITHWQELINKTGKALLTEDCHNSPQYPNASDDWCPMNFFRSSTDINSNFVDIIGVNLASTIDYNNEYPTGFVTRPGCWAYPDMLEVGNIPNQYNATANDMDQTHFSAWCVVSAPLILGFDLTNNDTMNDVWDIITNPETIAVSQNWAGTLCCQFC